MADVTLDTEAQLREALDWHSHAEDLAAHGRTPHVRPEQLQELVGTAAASYIAARLTLEAARTAAYERVAGRAEAHAAGLDATRVGLQTVDEDNARRIAELGT